MNYLKMVDSGSNAIDLNDISVPESFSCVENIDLCKDNIKENSQIDTQAHTSYVDHSLYFDVALILAHFSESTISLCNKSTAYDCLINNVHHYIPNFLVLIISSATVNFVSTEVIKHQLRRDIGENYHVELQSFQVSSHEYVIVIATKRSLIDTCPLMFYPNNMNDTSMLQTNCRVNFSKLISLILYNIRNHISRKPLITKALQRMIVKNDLTHPEKLLSFIESTDLYITDLYKICDLANNQRATHAAYHTPMHIAYSTIEYLPNDMGSDQSISILEPSVGAGIFVYLLAKKYTNKKIHFDCVDIDINVLNMMYALINKHNLNNIHIQQIHGDFLLCDTLKSNYDLVVGNPPFMKVMHETLKSYQARYPKSISTNIFTFFLEKILKISKWVALITPKALLNVAEYMPTRELMDVHKVIHINDFNEKAFNVKIETISFVLELQSVSAIEKERTFEYTHQTLIYSYLTKTLFYQNQQYITNNQFDTWLLYRNNEFDDICNQMKFDVFKVFRDRILTKSNTKLSGKYQVIKARNIDNNNIINIPNYDRYVDKDDLCTLAVAKFMNQNVILIPNLTTKIRAARLPKNSIADGSAAILYPKYDFVPSDADIEFFSSQEFNDFYKIARNYGTRSLNIDKVSVKYFGILKKDN